MKQLLSKAIDNFWLKQYILLGYGAKGIIYLSIGISAIQAAIISNREASGTYLTLALITDKPLGKLFVCFIAIALTGYVLRRLLQVILMSGHDNPWCFKSIFQRLGYIVSGMSYAGVAYSALNIVFRVGEYDDTTQDIVDELFEQAWGEWLILLGGILVTTIGLGYIYGAYTGSYVSEFNRDDIHHRLDKWATRMGKLGVAARGIAFVLSGIFLIQAAIFGNSKLAGGMQNVLQEIGSTNWGWLWLSLIGMGLICYGLYMFVATVYRRYAIR